MLAGKDCFAGASQIVYHMGKCGNPEELAGQFEDMLNIRFYHPEYRLMKLKSMPCERPASAMRHLMLRWTVPGKINIQSVWKRS